MYVACLRPADVSIIDILKNLYQAYATIGTYLVVCTRICVLCSENQDDNEFEGAILRMAIFLYHAASRREWNDPTALSSMYSVILLFVGKKYKQPWLKRTQFI